MSTMLARQMLRMCLPCTCVAAWELGFATSFEEFFMIM